MTNQQRRSIKVWQVLISCAAHRETITYGRLADLIAEPIIPLRMGLYLSRVAEFCALREKPNLAVIVVNRETGETGRTVTLRHKDVDQERAAVFDENWFAMTPPVAEDFRP